MRFNVHRLLCLLCHEIANHAETAGSEAVRYQRPFLYSSLVCFPRMGESRLAFDLDDPCRQEVRSEFEVIHSPTTCERALRVPSQTRVRRAALGTEVSCHALPQHCHSSYHRLCAGSTRKGLRILPCMQELDQNSR